MSLEKLIDFLEIVAKRPRLYASDSAAMENFLIGVSRGFLVDRPEEDYVKYLHCRRDEARERGYDPGSGGLRRYLLQKMDEDESITDEIVSCEIETWRKFGTANLSNCNS